MKIKSIALLVFLILLIFNGCKDSSVSNPTPAPVIEPPKSNSFLTFANPQYIDSLGLHQHMNKLIDYPEGFDYNDLSKLLMKSPKPHTDLGLSGLWYSKVRYTSVGNDGQPRELTGLMIYPYLPFHNYTVPIVSFNHATEPMRERAPSYWGITENPANFNEVVIAAGLALKNQWCVIMPDYQGMGDDKSEFHPFCNKNLLGKAVADLCAKTIAYLQSSSNNTRLKWNGQLFLMGFSEGAFITMAGLRELELRGTNVDGAACMDGPYDLTGTMLPVMLSNNPFPSPYFLPYMIMGSNAVPSNGKSFDPNIVINATYRSELIKVMDGYHTGEEITAKMPASTILKEIFTPEFIDSLNNPNSSQFKILHDNNTWVNWTPKTQMFIAHGLDDDCVPYGNFVTFKNYHQSANLKYFELGETFDYLGSKHVSIAPWAFLQGSTWIQSKVK